MLLRAALLLPAESERDARQAELLRAAASACAAARPEAAELAQAHAAGVPQPEAATAAWELPAVGVAAEVPDVPQAEEAAVVVSGATVQQPAAAAREDAEVQPRAAAPSGAQELRAVLRQEEVARQDVRRAAVPSALPSEAASICRSLVVVFAPARPRAAARSAHAMRSLRIASRSEPSLQAARNEGWS
ncbi:hypothetical protein M2191_006801 [Bradyrhizobium japonicum]|nr:hypothetical protein [Bradyrhizobium japonicum]